MGENRSRLASRKSILEDIIEKPPYKYKETNSTDSNSLLGIDRSANIVNIRLGDPYHHQQKNDNLHSKEHCQTTINLYINEPHLNSHKKCDCKSSNFTTSTSESKNRILLGKNIPNHSMMKRLLNDFEVKKYTSAPTVYENIRNSSLLHNKPFVGNVSAKSSDESAKRSTSNEICYGSNKPNEADVKETRLLYKKNKSKRDGIEMGNKCFEKIKEEKEELPVKEHVGFLSEERYFGPHQQSFKFDKTKNNAKKGPLVEEKTIRNPIILTSAKDPSILFRDTALAQDMLPNETLTQPRRIKPSFKVRTQLVRDILETEPTHTIEGYHDKILRNHRKMFETLKKSNLEDLFENNGRNNNEVGGGIINENVYEFEAGDHLHKHSELRRALSNKNKKDLQKNILNGPNHRHLVCSTDSHGSYEEYRRNLIQKRDGTLYCKNEEFPTEDNEEAIWSRAETRNMITSEFIRDKVRRFEKFLEKRRGRLATKIQNRESHEDYVAANQEAVSLPKETKYAISKFLVDNSHKTRHLHNGTINSRTLIPSELQAEKYKATYLKPRSRMTNAYTTAYNQVSRDHIRKFEGQNNAENTKFWPGVAERVAADIHNGRKQLSTSHKS